MRKGYVTLIGFSLLLLGLLSVLFTLVGLRFTFFKFITDLGTGPALIINLVMIFGGGIVMYLSKLPSEDDEDLSPE